MIVSAEVVNPKSKRCQEGRGEFLQDFVFILLLASKNPMRTSHPSEKRTSSATEISVVRAIGFKAVK